MNNDTSTRLPHAQIVVYGALALALATVSIAITGYKFGINNNVFHIPYVLNLASTPEFSDDAFYATLKYFASVVWPVMRSITTDSNVESLFFLANFISRAAAFAGILFLIRAANITTLVGAAICGGAIAATRWFQGVSIVGDHGMFIEYFTHSEATWVLVFSSLALCSLNRLTSGAALTGLAVSVNAFVGIWLLIINGVATLVAKKSTTIVALLRAAVAFILFAAPAAVWIALAIGKANGSEPFSFMQYIRQYDPGHFLFEAVSAQELGQFALLVATGVVAAWYMPNRKFWLAAQAASVSIFLIGIPLPYWVDNRFIFNLCLMRSTGIEQAVAIALAAIAATKLILVTSDVRSRILGAIVLLALATLDKSTLAAGVMPVALLAGIAAQRDDSLTRSRLHAGVSRFDRVLFWLSVAVFAAALGQQVVQQYLGVAQLLRLAVIGATFAFLMMQGIRPTLKHWPIAIILAVYLCGEAAMSMRWRAEDERQAMAPDNPNKSWTDIIKAVRSSDLHDTFLIPVAKKRREADFQLLARRKVWVDDKQGAAVMWAPWFANQWMSRHKEVLALNTPEKFITYAQANKIPNVVIETDTKTCPAPAQLKLESRHFVVCRLEYPNP